MNPEKQLLRRRLLEQRQALSAGETGHKSQLIFDNFSKHADQIAGASASSVGFYYPIRGEVDTRLFFRFFKARKKTCLFPKTDSEGLGFFPVADWSELQLASFGICEPRPHSGVKPVIPDLIFVPAIGYSRECQRLGFGAGHYDRTVARWIAEGARAKVKLVGLAYDFQILTDFPGEAHDQLLDAVITETDIFSRKAQS